MATILLTAFASMLRKQNTANFSDNFIYKVKISKGQYIMLKILKKELN